MENGMMKKWIGAGSAAVLAVSMVSAPASAQVPAALSGQVTANTIYFYDYGAGSTANLIPDISGNGHDLVPGPRPNPAGGELPGAFSFGTGPNPGDASVDLNLNGALTTTENMLGHQAISDAGGFFWETWIKRTADTPLQDQHLWNPEGTHSIELTGSNAVQLAVRAQGVSQDGSPNATTTTALPLGEWHHIAAVFTVTTPLAPGADPAVDPLIGDYALFIDGVQSGVTIAGRDWNAISFPGANLEDDVAPLSRQKHGIGTTNFGTPGFQLRGELANTQLALLPEPASAALLGLGGMMVLARRRK